MVYVVSIAGKNGYNLILEVDAESEVSAVDRAISEVSRNRILKNNLPENPKEFTTVKAL